MGQLSHIEDIEQREEQARARERQAQAQIEHESSSLGMTAREEEDFHGLNKRESMSNGHKFLIVLALLITAAAILYIVNSWVHFV
jgi:hypothetical protein